jgi:hypothetical protein
MTMSALFAGVFALGGWRAGLSRLSDNSFFWHLQTGRHIIRHGLPHHDLYSFTAPHASWVVQSWLAEALYGAVDRVTGPFGVRVLGGVTGAVLAALIYGLSRRLTANHVRAVSVTLAAAGASFTLWSERPLFLGLVLFVAVLWTVELPDSLLGRRPLVTLPVLFWLWANVHGTFSLGFAYLALHVAGSWLDGSSPFTGRQRQLVIASVVAFAVCFINPYGAALVTFPVHLLGRGDILKNVIEWRSPNFRSVQGLGFAGFLVVYVAVLARSALRPSRRDLIVTIPFVLLAFWAQRNIAVAPLVALPVLSRAVARPRPDRATTANTPIAVALAGLAALFVLVAAGEGNFDARSYPVAAFRYVEQHGLLGRRLVVDDGTGGYVILKYWPHQRVFVDDRFDMYPRPVLHDFLALADGSPRSSAILDRWRIEVVVWDPGAPLAALLDADAHWQRVFRTQSGAVFTRR